MHKKYLQSYKAIFLQEHIYNFFFCYDCYQDISMMNIYPYPRLRIWRLLLSLLLFLWVDLFLDKKGKFKQNDYTYLHVIVMLIVYFLYRHEPFSKIFLQKMLFFAVIATVVATMFRWISNHKGVISYWRIIIVIIVFFFFNSNFW